MADVVDSDLNKGPETKWYVGGALGQETKTIDSAMVSAGGFALAKTADYGLCILVKNGVQIDYTGFKADATTPATESNGIEFVKYTGITSGDVIDVYYVDVETTGLTHIASAKDFKSSSKADSKKTAVHGQKNKITTIGTNEHLGSFSQLMMTSELKSQFVGSRTTGPIATEHVWSNKVSGFKKVGCLVGKKADSSGNVVHKWGLIGVSFNGHDQDFPTEDAYTDSFNVDIDYLLEWEKA